MLAERRLETSETERDPLLLFFHACAAEARSTFAEAEAGPTLIVLKTSSASWAGQRKALSLRRTAVDAHGPGLLTPHAGHRRDDVLARIRLVASSRSSDTYGAIQVFSETADLLLVAAIA